MAPPGDGVGGVHVHCPASHHLAPIRFIGLVALLSGIASPVTSGALSHSPPRPRLVAHLSPPLQDDPAGEIVSTPPEDGGARRQHAAAPGDSQAGNNLTEAAEGRRPPPIHSDSILDMIDTEEVDRVLARKREEMEEEERRRVKGVESRTAGRKAGREKDHRDRRRGNDGSADEKGAHHRGRGARNGGKGDPRRLHRGNKGGHRDGSGSRHRVSLSRLAKWVDVSPLASYPVHGSPVPVSSDPIPPVRDGSREKILKSSKDALVVTRREYLRRDWCRTEPLIQRVKVDGCLTRSMVNGFCYGQCNSFYIPRSPSELPSSNTSLTMSNGPSLIRNKLDPLSMIPILYTQAFMSCAFCKPKEVTWVTITLRCPAIRPAQLTLRRRVERIKQCKCISEVLN